MCHLAAHMSQKKCWRRVERMAWSGDFRALQGTQVTEGIWDVRKEQRDRGWEVAGTDFEIRNRTAWVIELLSL